TKVAQCSIESRIDIEAVGLLPIGPASSQPAQVDATAHQFLDQGVTECDGCESPARGRRERADAGVDRVPDRRRIGECSGEMGQGGADRCPGQESEPPGTGEVGVSCVHRVRNAKRGPERKARVRRFIFRAEIRYPWDLARRGYDVASETITVIDNRTGTSYELPITDGTIRALDLRQVKTGPDDFGLMTYDPAYMNTASCRSAITYIDGDRGILRYRGYPIEQLAENASFLEVAYLLHEGELPNQQQLDKWTNDVRYHTYVHTNIIRLLSGFRSDAHPMGMMLGIVGALSTFYPDAKNIHDPESRYIHRVRLMAKLPTIAAFCFRHSRGLPFEFPRNDLDYIGNFVNMTFSIGGQHEANPVLQRALETLLILHADHEQNCSTSAVRAVGSSGV